MYLVKQYQQQFAKIILANSIESTAVDRAYLCSKYGLWWMGRIEMWCVPEYIKSQHYIYLSIITVSLD